MVRHRYVTNVYHSCVMSQLDSDNKSERIILFTRFPASASRKYTLNEFKAADYRHWYSSRISEMMRHVVNTIYTNVSHEINCVLYSQYSKLALL